MQVRIHLYIFSPSHPEIWYWHSLPLLQLLLPVNLRHSFLLLYCRSPAASSRCCAGSRPSLQSRSRVRPRRKPRPVAHPRPRCRPIGCSTASGVSSPATRWRGRCRPTPPRIAPDREHPPGLYGADEGFRAVNVLAPDATLPPFDPSWLERRRLCRPYPTSAPKDLSPYLLRRRAGLPAGRCAGRALAQWRLAPAPRRSGRTAARRHRPRRIATAGSRPMRRRPVRAQCGQTRPASPMSTTGNSQIDETSRAGLAGLSRELANRTALEPGDPIGVDIAKDELAFFPLLYWPIDPSPEMPTSATLARIDAYMKQGGSILFDTRDELDRTPGSNRLRRHAGSRTPPQHAVRARYPARSSRCRATTC